MDSFLGDVRDSGPLADVLLAVTDAHAASGGVTAAALAVALGRTLDVHGLDADALCLIVREAARASRALGRT